ncbi:MAG: hypothetical protein KDB70_08480 [Mycobacterium sp.]|nr:hypothetical protein [Mycobacterium sp.]
MAANGTTSGQVMIGTRILPIVVSWTGQASDAADENLERLRTRLGDHSQQVEAASAACTRIAGDIESLKTTLSAIDRDASTEGFTIDRATGQVTPTDPDWLKNSALHQQQKIDLEQRVAGVLTEASRIDEELTRALTLNAGAPGSPSQPAAELALPPPLAPNPNDDPWKHGGDRRWTSVATEGLKQKAVAAASLEMLRNDQIHAADLLDHYLGNTGEPVTLPAEVLDVWLTDTTQSYDDKTVPPATQINANLRSIERDAVAQARATGKAVTLTGNTPWKVVAGDNGDEVRTLGHYSLSTAYTITMNPDGTYVTTYRNDVSDWYNFATVSPMPAPKDLSHNISNWAHDLQAVGIAQDFLVTGSSSVKTVQGRVS